MARAVTLLAVIGGIGLPPRAISAEIASPVAHCLKVGNDDATRKLTKSLVADARRVFDFAGGSDQTVQETTTWRCMSGRVWICNYGANLPCGKGDVSKTSEGGDQFCADNPNADDIPMVATGHSSIHRWRCRGRGAVIDGQPFSIDRRGFVVQFWKPI